MPREKLVVDHSSAKLGTSTIPIRTALQRLQSEGLVEIIPHTGAIVTEISADLVTEVFSMLEALEILAFAQAAKHLKESDLVGLQNFVKQMDEALEKRDSNLWSDLNSKFHRQVTEITHMKLLIDFTYRTLDNWDRLRRYFFKQDFSGHLHRAQAEHREMLELLRKGDEPALIAAVSQQNRGAGEFYHKLLESAGMGNGRPLSETQNDQVI